MKPGRELDVLIAEKVLGFTPDRKGWRIHGELIFYNDTACCYDYERLPKYSADIKAAWVVVELPIFEWAIGRNANGKWEVFNPRENNLVVALADTAPLAICLAILKIQGLITQS